MLSKQKWRPCQTGTFISPGFYRVWEFLICFKCHLRHIKCPSTVLSNLISYPCCPRPAVTLTPRKTKTISSIIYHRCIETAYPQGFLFFFVFKFLEGWLCYKQNFFVITFQCNSAHYKICGKFQRKVWERKQLVDMKPMWAVINCSHAIYRTDTSAIGNDRSVLQGRLGLFTSNSEVVKGSYGPFYYPRPLCALQMIYGSVQCFMFPCTWRENDSMSRSSTLVPLSCSKKKRLFLFWFYVLNVH